MRHLIDNYIQAEESAVLSSFDDFSLIELLVDRGAEAVDCLPENIRKNEEAVAEVIENNVRKLIIDETPINPKYYEKMSVLLDSLIRQRKQQVIEYKQYLDQIVELTKRVKHPEQSGEYPSSMNTSAKRALYDNLGGDEDLVENLDQEIINTRRDAWRGNRIKEREIRIAISKHVAEDQVEYVFNLVKNQSEY